MNKNIHVYIYIITASLCYVLEANTTLSTILQLKKERYLLFTKQ